VALNGISFSLYLLFIVKSITTELWVFHMLKSEKKRGIPMETLADVSSSLSPKAASIVEKRMLVFYTVLCDKWGYPVKYLDPDSGHVKQFCGPFNDPGEASQEFKASIGPKDGCYLDLKQFQAKARAFAALRKRIQAEQVHT
jgi:hypothetical protein